VGACLKDQDAKQIAWKSILLRAHTKAQDDLSQIEWPRCGCSYLWVHFRYAIRGAVVYVGEMRHIISILAQSRLFIKLCPVALALAFPHIILC